MLKRQVIPHIGKNLEQVELSYTAGRNVKLYGHFRKRLGISYEHVLFIQPSNLTPGYCNQKH